jgi:hypothetical protein
LVKLQAAALTALTLIRQGYNAGVLKLPPREVSWLDRLQKALDTLPATETEFIQEMMGQVETSKFVAADYELA